MHRELKELLPKAEGLSQWVVVVSVDTRGFTQFSRHRDSAEVALFAKKLYAKVIDEYFPTATFFKPTGDGLLIVTRLPQETEGIHELVVDTVRTSLDLLTDFGSLCDDDLMVTFPVPQEVGIGIARGPACCLVSGDKVLDYSGATLNVACRLTDLARPSGIVLAADFGVHLLPSELSEMFEKDYAFLPGIAQRESIDVYCTKDRTRIPPLYKYPIEDLKWRTVKDTKSLWEIKRLGRFTYRLPSTPVDPGEILIKISHDKLVNGVKLEGYQSWLHFKDFELWFEAGQPRLSIPMPALAERLAEPGLEDTWLINIEIMYPEW